MKWSLWLSAIAAAPVWAHAVLDDIDRAPLDLVGEPPLSVDGLEHSYHSKRDEETRNGEKCSPPVYNSQTSISARDLTDGPYEWERNFTLAKRTMTLPGQNMDTFMLTEVGKPGTDPIIWQTPTKDGGESDTATSSYEKYKGETFGYGTAGLCGCTTLVIISRTAVYIGHYWENISFAPDVEWLEEFGSVGKCWTDTVIKGLNEGVSWKIKNRVHQPQVSLKNCVKDINDKYIKAYLMRPSKDCKNVKDGYRVQWDDLKKTVTGLIPRLAEEGRYQEVTYNSISIKNKKHRTTARGKILFKYDPDHNGKEKNMLWIESALVHEDEW